MTNKIYTRTGDDGTTELTKDKRASKDDMLVETYGAVDELNSVIGIMIAHLSESTVIPSILTRIQHELINLSKELFDSKKHLITKENIARLEFEIDELESELPPLETFILPGGNLAAATSHLARTICRRAERRITTLSKKEKVNDLTLKYLNRLSDLLFVIARTLG
jgi:cob(I)alamin adenosyltransferase